MTEQAKVKVDGKALAAVKRGLNKENKVAKELYQVYLQFGQINAQAIESIGGTLDKETGKYKGYNTKVLNAWRIENFPTMTKDGKLKDSALFSHAISMHLREPEITEYLKREGLDHLYRPDVIMKRFSQWEKAQDKAAMVANETEEEKALREANETHDKVAALLQGITGPLNTLAGLIDKGKVDVGLQRELAMILCRTFDSIDAQVKATAQSDYQQEKAEKHEEVRNAA